MAFVVLSTKAIAQDITLTSPQTFGLRQGRRRSLGSGIDLPLLDAIQGVGDSDESSAVAMHSALVMQNRDFDSQPTPQMALGRAIRLFMLWLQLKSLLPYDSTKGVNAVTEHDDLTDRSTMGEEAEKGREDVRDYLFGLLMDGIGAMNASRRDAISTKLRAWAAGVAVGADVSPQSPSSAYVNAVAMEAEKYADEIEPDVEF